MDDFNLKFTQLDTDEPINIVNKVNNTAAELEISSEATGTCSIFSIDESGFVDVYVEVLDTYAEEFTVVLLPIVTWMLTKDDFDENSALITESEVSELSMRDMNIPEEKYIFIIKRDNNLNEDTRVYVNFDYSPTK